MNVQAVKKAVAYFVGVKGGNQRLVLAGVAQKTEGDSP